MTSANDSSKRRRLLNDASPGIKCLSDLPSAVLTHVACYLDAPTRAFFAASLSDQNAAAASNERNIAIVDHEWSTLDFGDIEKDLVIRLTDDDISSILMCIDAGNKLKMLKLTNCLHITGAGLEPLRGSTIIKQIDLSLVGKHQSPKLSSLPPISCQFVLPILDSIIGREDCALKHLQFPKVWRKEEREGQFDQFLHRYDNALLNRGISSCSKCSCNLPTDYEHWIQFGGDLCGIQNDTCCECLKYYCHECDDDEGEYWLNYCEKCERQLCLDCQSMKHCTECHGPYCVDCKDFIDCSVCNDNYRCKDCRSGWKFCCKCERHFCGEYFCDNNVGFSCQSDDCDKRCCSACKQEFGWPKCTGTRGEWEYCNREFCYDCSEKKNPMESIRICKSCNIYSCGECRVFMTDEEEEESNEICTGCIQVARRVLMEENKKVQEEHEDAKAEIKELKEQLKYERGRVKELEEEIKHISFRKN